MLTADQAAALRSAVKAAPVGDPLHTAYHAGDGKNRRDVWTTTLDDKGDPLFIDGIEQRTQGDPVFTDAGGDIDALAAHFTGPDAQHRHVWLSTVHTGLVRAAVDLDELVSATAKAQAKVTFLLGGELLDFTTSTVRDAFTALGPVTAAAVGAVATRPAMRLDALALVQAGDHYVSTFPPSLSRSEVFDALYEQRGDTVAKR